MTTTTSRGDWEMIGTEGPVIESRNIDKVPRWVMRAYRHCGVHHNGVIHRFNGKHYQYKIKEKGQGGGYHVFYRKPISS